MRLILGFIIGVSLTVGGAYIADAVVGTEALLLPPEVALQFVLWVAFQLEEDPPPTQ